MLFHSFDGDAHAARAAGDGAHGGIEVSGSQVGGLDLGDFLGLGAGELAYLLGMRLAAALFHLGGLHDQHRRGRRLHDEGEALVRERGDYDRNRQAGFQLLRLGVERLAEFHDVQAALTQRGADRRARIRLSRGYLQLDVSDYFLCYSLLLVGASGREDPPRLVPVIPAFARTTIQAFSTCEKSNSTGVDRPKMVTDTRNLLFS